VFDHGLIMLMFGTEEREHDIEEERRKQQNLDAQIRELEKSVQKDGKSGGGGSNGGGRGGSGSGAASAGKESQHSRQRKLEDQLQLVG